MSKKDNIDSFDTSHKSLYISLIVLFPIMFLVAFVIFYLVEVILLTNHYSIFEVLMIHKKNIAITGICMWALCFYFVLGSLNFAGKTKNLSMIRWATMASCSGERKDLFRRGKGRNCCVEQRNIQPLEASRKGRSEKLCARYSPCGHGLPRNSHKPRGLHRPDESKGLWCGLARQP